jgi:hypothetical protein
LLMLLISIPRLGIVWLMKAAEALIADKRAPKMPKMTRAQIVAEYAAHGALPPTGSRSAEGSLEPDPKVRGVAPVAIHDEQGPQMGW